MDPVLSAAVKTHVNAAKITSQSKSNLALAFVSLGPERKRDITVFYAFCRVIDDIAGVEMDLSISRYATFEELRVYCYRVASAVGLVSIAIFGYRNPRCKEYALELGLALQMTNIIRDVGKDLRDGRIYLPQEDLARFHYSETELQDRQYGDRFVRLMEFEAARAREFFSRAAAALPAEDRRRMVPAEIMGSIYRGLLRRIELDKFRVFEKEYGLSKIEKAGRIAVQLFKSFLNLPGQTPV